MAKFRGSSGFSVLGLFVFDCGANFGSAITDFETPNPAVGEAQEKPFTTDLTMSSVSMTKDLDHTMTVPMRRIQNSDVVSSIAQFLSKPRLLTSFTWTPAQPAGTNLFDARSFASVTGDSEFIQKLTGFTGIRYTTNVKIVLNASPFQQGKLRLVYFPNATAMQTRWEAHRSTRVGISQLPGVEMTTMEKSAQITVPFVSFQEYYDMVGDFLDPVSYAVSVFAPLENGAAATRTTASVAVWVWFTDVELFGASTITPQSKMARRSKTRAVAEQEEKPLSHWLSATSKLASSMASIPVISGIAAPTAVWMKYASGVASAFGYSRPVQGEPTRTMAPHYHNAVANADGINVGTVMALNKEAKARIISDFSPAGMDETSINFIKRQWSFAREFQFPASAANGAQLFEQTLSCLLGAQTAPQGALVTPTPEFLARFANYYRGGFEFCFKFVKTGFHAGSLAVSYAVGNTTASISLQDANVLHRTVVDIQDGDSVCLSFPFISSRDYLPVAVPYGRVYAHVLNQLVAPETVPQQITVQVFVRGMEDLQFSGYTTFLPSVPQIVAQGGELENDDEIVCQPVGGALIEPKLDGQHMMDCMSENVTSLLQFAKAGVRVYFPDSSAPGVRNFTFNPSILCPRARSSDGAVTTEPIYAASALNLMRGCFAFQRGGYELNIVPTETPLGPSDYPVNHRVYHDTLAGAARIYQIVPNLSSGINYTTNTLADNQRVFRNLGPLAVNNSEYGLSVTLPYRSAYRVNPLQAFIGPLTTSNDEAFRSRFNVTCHSADTIILRPAEDYQLMYWLGVPPIFTY